MTLTKQDKLQVLTALLNSTDDGKDLQARIHALDTACKMGLATDDIVSVAKRFHAFLTDNEFQVGPKDTAYKDLVGTTTSSQGDLLQFNANEDIPPANPEPEDDVDSRMAQIAKEVAVASFRTEPLTALRKAIMKAAVEIYYETGDYLTQQPIYERMTNVSQNQVSYHFKWLVKNGYLHREPGRHRWWPLLNFEGKPVKRVLKQCPVGYAKGYKPMSAPIGQVGRVS